MLNQYLPCRLARPTDRLKQKYTAFQNRMVSFATCSCKCIHGYIMSELHNMSGVQNLQGLGL